MLFLTFQKSSRNYSYVIWNYNVDPWIIRATMVPVLQYMSLDESDVAVVVVVVSCLYHDVFWYM